PSLPSSPADPRIDAARAELARLTLEELRLTGAELEQRAGAVISVARRLDPLRSEAPAEVAAVEAGARRLARTLAASEFRDLEARRSTAQRYLTALGQRLEGARDAAAAAAVEDLVRSLGGGVPTAATTATARYDDERQETRWDLRAVVTGAPGV